MRPSTAAINAGHKRDIPCRCQKSNPLSPSQQPAQQKICSKKFYIHESNKMRLIQFIIFLQEVLHVSGVDTCSNKFKLSKNCASHLSLSWASPVQSTHPHPTSWRSILILSTHLRLGLPSHSPQNAVIKILCVTRAQNHDRVKTTRALKYVM